MTDEPEKKKRAPRRYWRIVNGKLYARLQYKDDNGKQREKSRPITDKRTAQSVVEAMRRELADHGAETLQTDKMTFAELAAKYEQTKLVAAHYSNGVKVSGKRSLAPSKAALKPLKEYFGSKRIRTISAANLEHYKQQRLNAAVEVVHNKKVEIENPAPGSRRKYRYEKETKTRPRKVASVNRELELLRAMFSFAAENDWLIKNPFAKKKGIISKAAETERDRILSFAEEEKLLAACAGRRGHIKAILICALDTAMRRGEMFKMRWQDVNFSTGEIFIPQINTKTDCSRTVGMTPRLLTALETLWNDGEKDLANLVFEITSTIKRAWQTVCAKAEIKDFRLHDCRHTATTRMIAAGVAHTEAMKITGHSELKTFLRYLNITPQTARNCAAKLDRYLIQNQEKPVIVDKTGGE